MTAFGEGANVFCGKLLTKKGFPAKTLGASPRFLWPHLANAIPNIRSKSLQRAGVVYGFQINVLTAGLG